MGGDSTLLELIAILGASALAIFIVAIAIMSGMQAVADNRPTLLSRVLAAQGLDPFQAMAGAEGREFGLAMRRCTRCSGRERCSAWLSSGARDGYQAFCPNTAFIQSLKRS
jgi:hypothetical protein